MIVSWAKRTNWHPASPICLPPHPHSHTHTTHAATLPQLLLEDLVTLTAPRTGPNACLSIGSKMPNGYTPAGARAAIFSNDCSTVPGESKTWRGTEQTSGWWQFSTIDGSACLTIAKQDIVRSWPDCEHASTVPLTGTACAPCPLAATCD